MLVAQRNLEIAYKQTGFYDRRVAELQERLRLDPADRLVPWHDRQPVCRQISRGQLEVGPADRAGGESQPELARARAAMELTLSIADEMKKFGGYIPGIRPGKKTAEYINQVLTRLTFGGAIYLSAVCVLPVILFRILNVPFFFGGTALLIVVGVGLDTVRQIEAFLLNRNYDGFLKKSKRRTGMRTLRI